MFLATAYTPEPPAAHIAQELKGAIDERRLDQGIEYLVEIGILLKAKNCKSFTGWVTADTIKEGVRQ
ncbi:unnamed protein product [Tuber aestivum]|uniref:Uncharacterized protein n=1 Tax=Tuber aestivum TaxID=59557 RepID=A0A292PZU7_9PEZI|nr:unnamed protein product [Tuber aestivum]